MVSVKKKKMKLFGRLQVDSLKKICRIEGFSEEGKKDELVERVARKLRLGESRYYSRTFGVSENISLSKHTLIPKHRVISEKEKEELFKKYSIKGGNLPRIRVRDPLSMSVDANPGDVMEITRESPLAGETKYYRLVVKKKRRR